ncbi:LysM peptidoglycan-binding domain-containing protein [Nonomuraea sp. NPDC059194]|uniref:LysM peptidoglycan-binding domain-containing protein n=1 Tax=Nonomuraea sp. NPDC059194 TaxID=3346764 RepID=UPI0036B53217
MRLTRRGRAVLVGLFALLSLGGFVLGAKATSWAIAQETTGAGHEGLPWVVVEKGDTLWTIAAAVSPSDDPSAVAREIMRLNGLSSSLIRPGGRLYLPDRSP